MNAYKIGDKVTIIATLTITEEAMPYGYTRSPHVEGVLGCLSTKNGKPIDFLPDMMYPVYMLEEASLKAKIAKVERKALTLAK